MNSIINNIVTSRQFHNLPDIVQEHIFEQILELEGLAPLDDWTACDGLEGWEDSVTQYLHPTPEEERKRATDEFEFQVWLANAFR